MFSLKKFRLHKLQFSSCRTIAQGLLTQPLLRKCDGSKSQPTVNSKEDFLDLLQEKIEAERKRIAEFKKQHGKAVLGSITVEQVYGGMRGMLGLVCDTSNLDANEGISFRGHHLSEALKKLPKADCGKEALPEGIFWLLLFGDIPSKENVKYLSCVFAELSEVPEYIKDILKSMPKELHPMTQLTIAVSALNKDSKFNKAYIENAPRIDFWKYVLEDSFMLISKLTSIAAIIYKKSFKDNFPDCCCDPNLDWSANYSRFLGFEDEKFDDLLRMYLTIHCDHEGGNVSAHASHLVGSALTDPFLSFAAGLNGLAGPLHGLANQEVLRWLDDLVAKKGIDASENDIKEYCENHLKVLKQVIPGYGHAVLRKTDPRFTCQLEYAQRVIPDDKMCQLVARVYKVIPPILKGLGKVKNPWPNVDAHSGVLLRHFGLEESTYYTVLFGVSRCLGLMAQLIWARALMLPIERPDSTTTDNLMKMVKQK